MGNCASTKPRPKSIIQKHSVFYDLKTNKSVYVKNVEKSGEPSVEKVQLKEKEQIQIQQDSSKKSQESQNNKIISLEEIKIEAKIEENNDVEKLENSILVNENNNNNESNQQKQEQYQSEFHVKNIEVVKNISLSKFGKIPQVMTLDSIQQFNESSNGSTLVSNNSKNSVAVVNNVSMIVF